MKKNELKKFRQQINITDKKLIKILSERFKISKKIGQYKAKHNLPSQDKKREKEMFLERNLWAEKLKMNKNLIEQIFKLITKKVRQEHHLFSKKLKPKKLKS